MDPLSYQKYNNHLHPSVNACSTIGDVSVRVSYNNFNFAGYQPRTTIV